MVDDPSGADDQSLIVNQLIVEFMSRTDAGEKLDVEQFIAAHPEHADELKRHFANVSHLQDSKKLNQESNTETIMKSNDISPAENDATAHTIVRGTGDSETSITRTHQHQNTNSSTEITIPETFGRYAIQKVLGQGAMGAVYLAKDTQLDRDVALKIPKFGDGNGVDDEELLERFYREARASATLRSPNICPVHDVGEIDGQHYITMAYIEGRPLKDFTKSKKVHPEKQIITIIRKLAAGLAEAHEIGVIHRDLKPANIMVDLKGEPVVMDFGLARRSASDDVQVTQSGAILGTPAYMAPEQVAGDQAAINHQVDIYALGIIMYELITGEMPFKGNLMAILQQIALNNPTKPSELRKNIDPRLEAICMKMMAGDQSKRYQSMTDVVNDLQEVLRNPDKRQKREEAKNTGPKPTSIPSANEESNPALISIEQPKSYAAQLREKKGKASKKSKSPGKTTASTKNSGNSDSGPSKKLLIAGGLGGLLLLLGIIFIVRVGKYDVQIIIDDPSITLSVDGEVLNITDGEDVYKLSAGEHKLRLEKDGFKTHVEEFIVTKDGTTVLRAVIINGKLDGLLNDEASSEQDVITEYEVTEGLVSSVTKAHAEENFALQFDGIDDYVETNCQLDVKQPFTVEFLLRAEPTTQPITAIVNSMEATSNRPPGFSFYRRTSDLLFSRNHDDREPTVRARSVLDQQQMLSVAGVWNGTELILFIDGKKQESPIETNALQTLSDPVSILLGAERHNGIPSWFFNGQLDEIRFSNAARYDSNYQPTSRFQPDGKTIALYHCDEGIGDILKDSSGNGHDGKIIGAKWVNIESPLQSSQNNSVTPPKVALEFDGQGRVVVDDIPWGDLKEITYEAFVRSDTGEETDELQLALNRFHIGGFNRWKGRWFFSIECQNTKTFPESKTGLPTPAGHWDHLAGVRNGNQIQLFVNGEPMEATQLPDKYKSDHGTGIQMGTKFIGAIGGVKISSSAKYAAAFVPPQRFSKEQDTLALYHYNEGSGNILKDSSGNGHDGEIFGAEWVRAENTQSPTSAEVLTSPEYEWTEPVNLGPIINHAGNQQSFSLSADALTLVLSQDDPAVSSTYHLSISHRKTLTAPWSQPVKITGTANQKNSGCYYPSLSEDQCTLLFSSGRGGGLGNEDLWMASRPTTADSWGGAVWLGEEVNSPLIERSPHLSSDELSLVFSLESDPDSSIMISTRATKNESWEKSRPLSDSLDSYIHPRLTGDDLSLFVVRSSPRTNSNDLFVSTRETKNDDWQPPKHLGMKINSSHKEHSPYYSQIESALYFASDRPGGQGGYDIWVSHRVKKSPQN